MKPVLRLEFGAFTNMEILIEQHCNNKDYNCVFFQRGFIDSMNKIFKVVWSKTKECYVVVSEVAKNNSGKKKVLASVLAALAVVGVGAGNVGAYNAGGGHDGGSNTVAIGNNAWAQTSGAVAIGNGTNANGSAPGANSVAIGYESNANGG